MNTPFDFKDMDTDRLVYIRPVDVTDLPDEVRDQAEGPRSHLCRPQRRRRTPGPGRRPQTGL